MRRWGSYRIGSKVVRLIWSILWHRWSLFRNQGVSPLILPRPDLALSGLGVLDRTGARYITIEHQAWQPSLIRPTQMMALLPNWDVARPDKYLEGKSKGYLVLDFVPPASESSERGVKYAYSQSPLLDPYIPIGFKSKLSGTSRLGWSSRFVLSPLRYKAQADLDVATPQPLSMRIVPTRRL